MTLGPYHVERVHLEKGAENFDPSLRVLRRLEGLPVKEVLPDEREDMLGRHDMGKETIRLVSFKGEFLKPCPGTKGYICCGYQILQTGTNCPLDCSYCILQAYFNQPSLRVFVNLEERLEGIGERLDKDREGIFRIGTGEFTDSLALEPILRWSDVLLPFFSKRTNVVLELKTKTDRIEGLLASKYRDRIVVSWSLNSPYIASREEHGAPAVEKRLRAAGKCQSEGFVVGFHFDPLIIHPNWKEEYLRTLDMMDKFLDPKKIIWISLGCLRYMPALKAIIRKRHPGTRVLDGEFVPGLDGKLRYFKPIRIDIYSFMKEKLEQWAENRGLYLCMESEEVWQKSLGWSPVNTAGLSRYLDGRVREIFR